MSSPAVSVVMPVFNGARYLRQSVESVREQSFTSWELIISDDNSTDESVDIAKVYCRADPRITLEKTIRRGGPAAARNRAIAKAKGRWIAFLDSDDTWHPDKLVRSVDFAESHNLALTYTAYFSENSEKRARLVAVPREVTYRDLLKTNHITTSTVLVDRQLVGDFRMNENYRFDDYVAWLEILKAGLPAGGLAEPLTTYRKHGGSFSSNKLEAARRVFVIYSRHQKLSWPKIAWYFANYALQGAIKHRPVFKRNF